MKYKTQRLRKGKTYEEIFGIEKANELKEVRRGAMTGNILRKGLKPWNCNKNHPNYNNWLESVKKTFRNNRGKKSWNNGLTKESDSRVLKMVKTRIKNNIKPNKLEKRFDEFLQNYFPNEWKYVGNGEVFIGYGNSPDFINVNGKKKVILLHGTFWHLTKRRYLMDNPYITKQDIENEDILKYEKYGFDCLVIWDDELNDKSQVLNKINEFIGGK